MQIRIPVAFIVAALFAFISASLLAYGCTATQATKAQNTLSNVQAATTQAVSDTAIVAPNISQWLIIALALEKLVGAYIIPALTKNGGTSASNSSTAGMQTGNQNKPNT